MDSISAALKAFPTGTFFSSEASFSTLKPRIPIVPPEEDALSVVQPSTVLE